MNYTCDRPDMLANFMVCHAQFNGFKRLHTFRVSLIQNLTEIYICSVHFVKIYLLEKENQKNNDTKPDLTNNELSEVSSHQADETQLLTVKTTLLDRDLLSSWWLISILD